ncbi:MAG: ATP-binding protein [Pseudomonadota bacterium]
MSAPRVPIRKSLSYRQARNAVLVAFVIGVVLSSAQIYLDYFSQRSEIQASVRDVVGTANRAAYHAAFNLDEVGATQITRGLVSNAPIVGAAITDHGGLVLGTARREDISPVSTASRWLFGEPQHIVIELLNEAEHPDPVGSLKVTVDPALTADSFLRRAQVVFLSGVLRNFVLSICMIAVFYFTTTKPILKASAPIQQGITDRQIPMPQTHQDDEIGVLISAFNDHLSTIEDQHKQIRETNENLEKLVAERTAQLAHKNAELVREREVALEASQSKSDFLAMMSHEIRTPMHGILGMAELLGESSLTGEQADYVEALTDSGRSLLTLMNSVLEHTKYEQGHFELHSTAFDLNRLVGGIVFLLSPTAEARHVLLTTHIEPDVPHYVQGDSEKLRQVLLNLLTNAIKFTEDGNVDLSISNLNATESDSHTLRFSVRDTGQGIPQKLRSELFEPFKQAGSHINQRHGGSGLGLSICRAIVLAQDGQIDFESEEGVGSTFWFELPFSAAEKPLDTSATQRGQWDSLPEQATILVVDDVAINRRLIEGQLGRSGFMIHSASNGREAVQFVEKHPVDLVLMDLQMPVMDGIEATRAIRKLDNRELAAIPVVGITANLDSLRREQCLIAGMSDVIGKPIDAASLRRLIGDVLWGEGGSKQEKDRVAVENRLVDKLVLEQHADALGKQQVEELYSEATAILRQRTSELLESRDDSQLLEGNAHALAGLSSNYGLPAMAAVCSDIEHQYASNTDKELDSQLKSLESTCSRTINAVRQALQQLG